MGALKELREVATKLHTHVRRVRFQDTDPAGIVFFARYFDYFHDAYVEFLRARGAPLEEAIRAGSWVAPLRHAEAEYLRPLRLGEEIQVSVVAVDLRETEYIVSYRVERDGELTCVGRTHHVAVDAERLRRTAVPEELRRALEAEKG